VNMQLFLSLVLSLCLLVTAQQQRQLSEALSSEPQVSTVAQLLQLNPQLLERASAMGPFTAFLPNNDAMAKINIASFPRDQLENLVKLHLVSKEVPQLKDGDVLRSQSGEQLTVKKAGNQFTVNGANVIGQYRQASGMKGFYVIDKVLTSSQSQQMSQQMPQQGSQQMPPQGSQQMPQQGAQQGSQPVRPTLSVLGNQTSQQGSQQMPQQGSQQMPQQGSQQGLQPRRCSTDKDCRRIERLEERLEQQAQGQQQQKPERDEQEISFERQTCKSGICVQVETETEGQPRQQGQGQQM